MLTALHRVKVSLGLLCACLASHASCADETGTETLTQEQISELIAAPSQSTETNNSQLNWQQWGEAEASAQSVVDAPVPNWGLLPDALPESYATLPAMTNDNAQAIANWQTFGVQGEIYRVKRLTVGRRQVGEASWYGPGFHGRKTASGDTFNMHALSAAHRTLPLPSYVRVTNTRNGMSVIVKINDRGPFHGNRIIDLSYAAAKVLGIKGTGHVALEPVDGEERVGKDRSGIALGSEPAYQVVLGNFADTHAAQLLQARLMKRLPQGIPVKLNTTPAPIVMHRVEVGPLASPAEVHVLIRSIRATRMGFAEEPLSIRPGKPY